MLNFHVVQANHGDCFILEFGTDNNPRYILIDGGPNSIYEKHLQGELEKIKAKGGKLDLLIVSHVDNDHIIGLLDLMAELKEQDAQNIQKTISIDAIWHNTFTQTVGSDVERRLKSLLMDIGNLSKSMPITNKISKGIKQGHEFTLDADALGIPINQGFSDNRRRLPAE